MRYLLVAAGGALGSVARYALDGFILRLASPYFPSGTFVVNAIGCLVFGVIIGLADGRSLLTPTGRLFLLIGLLGGFTTFSTYILQGTITDHRDGVATDYGPGVGWPEDRNTIHWLENRATIPAVEISVDIVRQD